MYKQKLRDFLDNLINLEQLKDFIDERLFELRQTPEMSEEQDWLSGLELIIHECAEGLRSDVEIFECIRLIVLPDLVSTIDISPKTSAATQTISLAAAPVREYPCPDRVLV